MKTLMSAVALATLASNTVWANTTTTTAAAPAATTTATAETVAPRLVDKLSLTIAGAFSGPSVASITGNSVNPASVTVDGNGKEDRNIFMETTVRGGYKVTDAVTVAAAAVFNYTPVRGQDVEFLDPYVRVSHSKLLTGPVALSGDLRFYIPTSTGAISADRILGIRNTLSATYAVPNTRWTLGLDTILRGRFYGEGARAGAESVLAYASPNASFQITPTLAASAFAEFVAHTTNASLTDFSSLGTYFGPGLSWDVTPSINVNPYLYFQNFRVNSESTIFAMNLSAKIL